LVNAKKLYMEYLKKIINVYNLGYTLIAMVALVLFSHIAPLYNWIRMSARIEKVMDRPAYTYGDFTSVKTLVGQFHAVNFRYNVGNQTFNGRETLIGGTFSNTGFESKLNGRFLVIYNHENPSVCIMAPSCIVKDSSDALHYEGRKVDWSFYNGAYLE